MKFSLFYGTVLSVLAAQATAQTFTDCSPLNSTCPPDEALGTSRFNETYNAGSSLNSDYWTALSPGLSFVDDGAQFQIAKGGDAPTIETNFYIFFGRVEVIMRAASGQGIISSIVLLSDDLDEIDWEIMGGNSSFIETNYYGKGNASQVNSEYFPCDNPQGKFHNYTLIWNSDQIDFHLDGTLVRTITYEKAVDNGISIFPQTPSQLKLGNWAGGDPTQPIGVRQWAGGLTDYSQGPFNMYVKSVKISDGTNNAKMYTYGDRSGSWQSIQIERGESDAAIAINAPPPLTISQRWNNLSSGAQIAIICSVSGVAGLLLILFVFFCVRQRRAGKRERAAADAMWEKEQGELAEYKRRMQREFAAKGGFVGVHHPR